MARVESIVSQIHIGYIVHLQHISYPAYILKSVAGSVERVRVGSSYTDDHSNANEPIYEFVLDTCWYVFAVNFKCVCADYLLIPRARRSSLDFKCVCADMVPVPPTMGYLLLGVGLSSR